ncbi:hypothetical protein HKX48_007946 [Thoreauomyces humboldtii]|nr:hypothetical protein HKX48_007946 [Thoreauomyces humboldtii]
MPSTRRSQRSRPALLFLLLASCAGKALADTASGGTCIGGPITAGSFDASHDYFADSTLKAVPTYSKNWDVSYHGYYKSVTIRTPGASDVVLTLYLCNATPPSIPSVPTALSVPVTGVAIANTDVYVAAFLERLSQLPSLQYLEDTASTLPTSPCFLQQVAQNTTRLYNNTTPMPTVGVAFGTQPPTLGAPQLSFIPVLAAMQAESTPLARAEWVKFFSLFYNTEATGSSVFESGIAKPYLCQAARAASLKTSSALSVAWVGTTVYAAPTFFSSMDPDYTTALISDAGYTPLVLPANSDLATTQTLLKNAGMFIEATATGSLTNISWVQLAASVYRVGADNVDQFPFEKGVNSLLFKPDLLRNSQGSDHFVYNHWAEPEFLLNELIAASGFSATLTNFQHTWFRPIAIDTPEITLTAQDCAATPQVAPPGRRLVLPAGLDCTNFVVTPAQSGTRIDSVGGGPGSSTIATIVVGLMLVVGMVGWVVRSDIAAVIRAVKEGGWRSVDWRGVGSGGGGGSGEPWTRAKAREGAIELNEEPQF